MKLDARAIATSVVNSLENALEVIMPSAAECRVTAEDLLRLQPHSPPAELAESAIRVARRWGATMGAATGAVASPITMLPAAAADALAMLRIEAKLAGVIAALLDPASLLDEVAFRHDVAVVVFPGAVSQALRKLGVRLGEHATKQLIRRYASAAVIKQTAEQVSRTLGVKLTQKAVATKAVPVVGAGIGAVWNWVEVQAIGRRAIRYHGGESMSLRPLRPRLGRPAGTADLAESADGPNSHLLPAPPNGKPDSNIADSDVPS
jgi:hypothetical protein